MNTRYKRPGNRFNLPEPNKEIRFSIGQRFSFVDYMHKVSTGKFVSNSGQKYKDGVMSGELIGYSMSYTRKDEIEYHVKLDNGFIVQLSTEMLETSPHITINDKSTYASRHDLPENDDYIKNSLFRVSNELPMDKEMLVYNIQDLFGIDVEYVDITEVDGWLKVFIRFKHWIPLNKVLDTMDVIKFGEYRFTHIKSS